MINRKSGVVIYKSGSVELAEMRSRQVARQKERAAVRSAKMAQQKSKLDRGEQLSAQELDTARLEGWPTEREDAPVECAFRLSLSPPLSLSRPSKKI